MREKHSPVEMIRLSPRSAPVIAECDVLVVGGGPAGVAASVASARAGADTILVEAQSYLGGLGTGGPVLLWPGFCSRGSYAFGGVPLEVVRAVETLGGIYYGSPNSLCRHGYVTFDCELLKYVFQETALGAGVRVIQGVTMTDVLMQGASIEAVVVCGKAGYQAIRAGSYVDATGDGDLIALSGARHKTGVLPISLAWCIGGLDFDGTDLGRESPFEDPAGYPGPCGEVGGFYAKWRAVCDSIGVHIADPVPIPNRRSIWTDGNLLTGLNPLDPRDLTKAHIESRRQAVRLLQALRRDMPGFGNAYLYQLSTLTGVRVGRLLDGRYVCTDKDLEHNRQFEDCIGIADRNTGGQHHFEIPLGCLIPRNVDNLLASGRCISVTPPANRFQGIFQEIREIPHCMVTGQAAGVACALASAGDGAVSDLDITVVRRALREQGVRFEPDESIDLPERETRAKAVPGAWDPEGDVR